MCSNNIDIQFETYKLHAELAERVAHIRESLNRLYSGMVVGLVAAMVLVNRLATGTENRLAIETDITWLFYALGAVISITWMLSIHSVRGRLKAKHAVLVALEDKLPFKFLRQEEEEYNKGCLVLRRSWSGVVMPSLLLIYCIVQLIQYFFCG